MSSRNFYHVVMIIFRGEILENPKCSGVQIIELTRTRKMCGVKYVLLKFTLKRMFIFVY